MFLISSIGLYISVDIVVNTFLLNRFDIFVFAVIMKVRGDEYGLSLVGDNIRKLRDAAGISQYELSRFLSIHPAAISGWERGVRQPDLAMIAKLAEYFNVSTDFIIGKETGEEGAYMPEDLKVSFRQVDWKALSEDERRILNAVIKSVIDKHRK